MAGESTRRLPDWMMVGAIAPVVIGDGDKKKNNNPKKKEKKTKLDTVDCGGKSSITTLPSSNSSSLKGKNMSKDADCGGGAPAKRKGSKKRKPRDDVIAPIHLHEESCDLTIEDLVTIAEEYVMLYNDESRLNRNLSATSSDLQDEQQTQITPLNSTREESLVEVADQGMLHLFLGPLLTKVPHHNKTSAFPTEDMGVFLESCSPARSDAPHQMVPISKKKTSLKNKDLRKEIDHRYIIGIVERLHANKQQ